MTFRAVELLKQIDLILAEDTRTTSILLKHYDISRPLTPYHRNNEHKVVSHLMDQLMAGKNMALLTDAGTPGISDPAFLLVRECIRAGIEVQCLPGATAFVPALVNSGLPINNFCFEGFLPLKKGRLTKLKQLAGEPRTMVIYESPVRLLKTLDELMQHMGVERPCCVSRELSKKFEENFRGSLKQAHDHFSAKAVKGEIVMVVGGKED